MKEGHVMALHLACFICFEVLVKFFVKSFVVINPPNAVHASLTNLLSVHGQISTTSETR